MTTTGVRHDHGLRVGVQLFACNVRAGQHKRV